jgi:hypothetical protein
MPLHESKESENKTQFSNGVKCLIGTPDNTLQALSQSKN